VADFQLQTNTITQKTSFVKRNGPKTLILFAFLTPMLSANIDKPSTQEAYRTGQHKLANSKTDQNWPTLSVGQFCNLILAKNKINS
jgi:hypothetical protein